MSTNAQLQSLIDKLTGSLEDATKFDKGNDSAGARVRKTLQEVVHGCKEARASVQATRTARKGS